MNKKFISLFAACSMITTVVAGLVQTAYADDVGVSVVVSEGSSANEKVLTFKYEGVESLTSIQGYFDLWDDDDNNLVDDIGSVTVDSFVLTVVDAQYKEADPELRSFYATESRNNRTISSDDHSFATATITVPGDIDIKLEFVVQKFKDGLGVSYSVDPVYVTIPKKSAPIPAITPAAVTAVEKQNTEAISGTGKYEAQAADIYGVEITPNDESVSGATVSVGGKTKDISFKTVYSGKGTVVFAVILASESGDPLPTLSADNVTPIVATVD